MTIKEMKERKRELGYSYIQIAEMTQLPVSTVQKVLGGITKSPRYETLRLLEEVLGEKKESLVCEAEAAYEVKREKRQGEYTVEDYLTWPEDERIELIDGVIFYMDAPVTKHQLITTEIGTILRNYIKKNQGLCIPFAAPIDVQLDKDDKTMVQPDVFVVCDRSRLKNGRLYGAPDFVIEVLSPSTRKKDMFTKLAKYANADVREYWIVDTDKKRVLVYDFESDDFVKVYTFEDKVPVGIFNGQCEVDFAEIYDYIRFLYEEE